MDFDGLPEEDWKGFRDAASAASGIEAQANTVLSLLIEACTTQRSLIEAKIVLTKSEGANELALLETPFGKGRLVLSWEMTPAELLGNMICERQRFDEYDRVCWEPVWGLKIPRYENPYSSANEKGLKIELDGSFRDDKIMSIYRAILSMTYSLINGPVLTSKQVA